MTVHNTGARAGQEVVQVYATDVVSSVVTPNTELVGFAKVALEYVSLLPPTPSSLFHFPSCANVNMLRRAPARAKARR